MTLSDKMVTPPTGFYDHGRILTEGDVKEFIKKLKGKIQMGMITKYNLDVDMNWIKEIIDKEAGEKLI